MTNFLDPDLAFSKISRKKRQQQNALTDSAATHRAIAAFCRSVDKQVKKADHVERQRNKAISDTMPEFIAAMDEEELAPFFFGLERLATTADRRRISTHQLRPEVVDEMHAEADEEEALTAEQEKRDAATAVEAQGKIAKAEPDAGAGDASAS